jgi:hypothetical protein
LRVQKSGAKARIRRQFDVRRASPGNLPGACAPNEDGGETFSFTLPA